MNKTNKKRSPSPVAVSTGPGPFSQNDALNTYLDNENNKAFSNPWHRLDNGLRLNRFRDFSEKEATRLNLNDADKKNLYVVLQKALNKGTLSSKSTVTYDQVKQEITEIKGLIMHRNSVGDILFQIVEKKNGVTFRKPRGHAVVPAANVTQESGPTL
jgi:hypothetical protein